MHYHVDGHADTVLASNFHLDMPEVLAAYRTEIENYKRQGHSVTSVHPRQVNFEDGSYIKWHPCHDNCSPSEPIEDFSKRVEIDMQHQADSFPLTSDPLRQAYVTALSTCIFARQPMVIAEIRERTQAISMEPGAFMSAYNHAYELCIELRKLLYLRDGQ